MKGRVRVPGLIKRVIAALSNKTNDLRTRFMIFFLLHRDQTLLLDKLQAIVHRNAASHSLHDSNNQDYKENAESESFVMYMNREPSIEPSIREIPDDSNIDLTNTLFKESEEEMELTENEDSARDPSKDNKGSETNTTLSILEDEYGRVEEAAAGEEDIDHAADLFIERFRRQIRLQKQLSLQERLCNSTSMLQQNV